MRHTAFCLQRVSHAHQEVSETHTNPYFLSNKTALLQRFTSVIGTIAFTSAANRTGVHLNRTPDHPFKQTLVRFVGVQPSSEDSVHIIQTNEL